MHLIGACAHELLNDRCSFVQIVLVSVRCGTVWLMLAQFLGGRHERALLGAERQQAAQLRARTQRSRRAGVTLALARGLLRASDLPSLLCPLTCPALPCPDLLFAYNSLSPTLPHTTYKNYRFTILLLIHTVYSSVQMNTLIS